MQRQGRLRNYADLQARIHTAARHRRQLLPECYWQTEATQKHKNQQCVKPKGVMVVLIQLHNELLKQYYNRRVW